MNHLRIYRYQAEKPICINEIREKRFCSFLFISSIKIAIERLKLDTTTKAIERIGALFHDPKHARYQKQITDLRDEIEAKDKRY